MEKLPWFYGLYSLSHNQLVFSFISVLFSLEHSEEQRAENFQDLTYTRIIVFKGDEQKWQIPEHKGIGFAVYLHLPHS